MKVRVTKYAPGIEKGNILWSGRFPMRYGEFPKRHPVGGGWATSLQAGTGENIRKFRKMGYWASCFPEGDGICFAPLRDQSHAQCVADIERAFGWMVE